MSHWFCIKYTEIPNCERSWVELDMFLKHSQVSQLAKLQAQVYDIIPPTAAMLDYAIVLEKLPANGQIFVGAQITVRL